VVFTLVVVAVLVMKEVEHLLLAVQAAVALLFLDLTKLEAAVPQTLVVVAALWDLAMAK
jgi:hypothetical protein